MEQTQVSNETFIPRRLPPSTSTNDDFAPFLEHPTKIDHLAWTGTTVYSLVSKDIVLLYKSSMDAKLAAKFQAMWFFRAKIRIRIVVQGQAQAFGQIVYTFTPRVQGPMLGTVLGQVASNQLHNFRIVPHICVDPSKSETYELDLPVCTPTGFYENTNINQHGSYMMERFVVNPLRSGTAVASTANICVYMSLVDVSLEGLTTLLSNSYASEKDPVKPSGVADVVSKFSAKVAPFVGPLAPAVTLFSTVSSTVGDVLRFFGFSKPPLHDISSFVTNRTCDNYSQCEGTSTAIVLGCSQKQPISISPDFAFGDLKDMSIDWIVSNESLIAHDIAILPAATAESFQFSIPVSPGMSDSNRGPSTLCGIATLTAFWCGDIDFEFEILASVFHRATLLIAWDPYATSTTGPAFADALNLLQNTTIQVAGSTTVKVTIPYRQPMPILKCQTFMERTNSGTQGETNGMVYVYLVNPVVSNGSTDGIYLNVYVSSQNIRFFAPEARVQTNTVITELLGSKYKSETFGQTSIVKFGPESDLDTIGFRCTGDVVRSVKDITSRAYMARNTTSSTGATTTTTYANYNLVNIPYVPADTVANPTPPYSFTSLGWFASAYLAYRGSIAYSFFSKTRPTTGASDLRADITSVTRPISTSVTVGPPTAAFVSGSCDPTTNPRYAITQINEEISARSDFVAPMIVPLDFFPSRAIYGNYKDNVLVASSNPGLQAANIFQDASLLMMSGDDAVFSWFLGFPRTNADM